MVLSKNLLGLLALLTIPVHGKSILSRKSESPITKGAELDRIEVPENFELSFKVKPLGIVEHDFGSIFHFTNGEDCCSVGERMPAIWFYPNSTKFHVSVDTLSQGDWGFTIDKELPLDQVTDVKMIFSIDKLSVYLNQILAKDVKIPNERIFGFANVYLGDPWHEPAIASISNINMVLGSNSADTASEIKLPQGPTSSITNTVKDVVAITNGSNPNSEVIMESTTDKSNNIQYKEPLIKFGNKFIANSNVPNYVQETFSDVESDLVNDINNSKNDPTLINILKSNDGNSPLNDYTVYQKDDPSLNPVALHDESLSNSPIIADDVAEPDFGLDNDKSIPIIVGASCGAVTISAATLIFFIRRRKQLRSSKNISEDTNSGYAASPNQLYENAETGSLNNLNSF